MFANHKTPEWILKAFYCLKVSKTNTNKNEQKICTDTFQKAKIWLISTGKDAQHYTARKCKLRRPGENTARSNGYSDKD